MHPLPSDLFLSVPLSVLLALSAGTAATFAEDPDPVAPIELAMPLEETGGTVIHYGTHRILLDPRAELLLEEAAEGNRKASSDVLLLSGSEATSADSRARDYGLPSADRTLSFASLAASPIPTANTLTLWHSADYSGVTVTAAPIGNAPQTQAKSGFLISAGGGPTIYYTGAIETREDVDDLVERYAGKIDYVLIDADSGLTTTDAMRVIDDLGVATYSILHANTWHHFDDRPVRSDGTITFDGNTMRIQWSGQP